VLLGAARRRAAEEKPGGLKLGLLRLTSYTWPPLEAPVERPAALYVL
jgi:hypothetical protein